MFETTLTKKELVAEGTMRFHFTKPADFEYAAGQSIDLTLVNPPETDAEGNMRAYSLCSAPEEADLSIATRMRDTAFKRVLGSLEPGAPLSFEGPFGSFFLHENVSRPAVFLAGGIGITPFRSILLDAAERSLPHTILLLYSNRRPEDAAFLDELTRLQTKNEHFKCIPTMTSMEQSHTAWEGERGYIDAAMLEKYVARDTSPIYYLAGPLAMVAAMRVLLNGIGVSNDDIKFEEFTGY